MCDRQELLVGYLYDELGANERREFDAHLAVCADCRGELDGLRTTRMHLASWAPPEPDLGFRMIRGGSAPASALPRRIRLAPVFAFAAAAVIVLAVAAAIAHIEIRYVPDGIVVRTGWANAPAPATAAAAMAPSEPDTIRAEFAALQQRLRDLEAVIGNGAPQQAGSGRMTDAQMLARVRAIVSEAESRQETAVARLLTQVVRDFDRQRQADFALIQQGIGEYQGLTNAEIANQMNRLLRVAAGQER